MRKDWDRKRSLVLRSSDNYIEWTSYKIPEEDIKYEDCTRKLWNDMTKNQFY